MKLKIFKFKKIKSTNNTAVRIIKNYNLDYGMNLHDSINSPRTHFEKGSVCMEPNCDEVIRNELEKHYKLQYFDDLNVFFGGVQAVNGNLEGGCDSRRGAAVIKVD